jgi:UrcA family protein
MMRSLIYPLEPAAHRVSVSRHNGDAVAAQSVVRFDDLNLDYAIDVRLLYRRIQAAAVSLCLPADGLSSGTVPSDGTRAVGVNTDTDTDRIIAATVAAIRHVALSEYHRRMTASRGDLSVNPI